MKITNAKKEFLVEAEIKRYSPRTIASYKSKLDQFELFLKNDLDITHIDDITPSVIKQYVQHKTREGCKGSTINSYLKVIKVFMQYCYDEGFGGFNAKRGGVKWVKEEKAVIRAFTVQDVRLLLANCKGIDFASVRDAAIITFLVETGIRAFELCNIRQQDIHDGYIVIKGKGGKSRSVPLTPVMKKAMFRYERAKEDYFEHKATADTYFLSVHGKKMENFTITRMIKRRGKEITGVRVSAHTLRHFFAQQSIKNGVSLYSLSRLLGHEKVAITQIYVDSLCDADIVHMNKNNSVLMNM